jgi:hypothetical protein
VTIVNDDSRVVNKLETSDNARVIIYDHNMFIVQATDVDLVVVARSCNG